MNYDFSGFNPPPFQPKEKMGRNELCWCGSLSKWKNCHRDRETQERPNIHNQINKFYEHYKEGYCLHPEAHETRCSQIIKAHSIQKNGGLKAIAENHHVLSAKHISQERSTNATRGKNYTLQSIKKASTFPGFCAHHDNILFKPAESGEVILSNQTCVLLSYRAICLEYFNKERAIGALAIQRGADKGLNFLEQARIQELLTFYEAGLKLGLCEVELAVKKYREILSNEIQEEFQFYAVKFSGHLPIVSCGAFFPQWDFAGNSIQIIKPNSLSTENIAINITSIGNTSWIILGWLGKEQEAAYKLAKSFQALPSNLKADSAIKYAYEYIENTYMRPSWWQSLSNDNREALLTRISTGLPTPDSPPHLPFNANDTPQLVDLYATDEICSEGFTKKI